MEAYEDLRLQEQDKVHKKGFLKRLRANNHKRLEQNLDFLEERYAAQDSASNNGETPLREEELPSLDALVLERQDGVSHTKAQNIQSHLNIHEREAVLEGIEFQAREIPFKTVLLAFCLMLLAFVLFIPKIYMRNNLYYASRNIIQLQAQIDSLNEENKHIKKQLEDIKFKNLTQELDF